MEIIHSNVAVKYNDAEKARFVRSTHPVFSMACHPTVLSFISSECLWTPSSPYANVPPVQDVPDPEDPANWRFQVVTCWLGKQDDSLDDAGRLAQVKQKASVLCEPYRSAVVWMPDDTKITYCTIRLLIGFLSHGTIMTVESH